jgi:DNA integrity scanning protein DisA with diadenylate cyclase activity
MQGIIDLILSNTLYMAVAGILVLVLIIFLMKKVFKMAMIVLVIILAYAGYLYMTEDDPMKTIQSKLDKGKATVKELDDATKEMREETLDKVMEDVEKTLKEKAKKR